MNRYCSSDEAHSIAFRTAQINDARDWAIGQPTCTPANAARINAACDAAIEKMDADKFQMSFFADAPRGDEARKNLLRAALQYA